MKHGFDFYENVYDKKDFEPYVNLITNIYSGGFMFDPEAIIFEFKNLLNHVAKKYLERYLPKKELKDFSLTFKETNFAHTGIVGYTDTITNEVIISEDCLHECLRLKKIATPIGTAIHECSHLIQNLAHDSFTEKNKPLNAYCFDLQKWLEDDWYKNTYNNLIAKVVVPYINSINTDKKLKVGTTKYLPSKILYTKDTVEVEAYTMQAHLQRAIGGIFERLITNPVARQNMLSNFFSTKNNFSGEVQLFNHKVKTKNYDFVQALIDLEPKDFANLLPLIEEYSKQFNCKTPTAIKSSRFSGFLKDDCTENFILIYKGHNSHEKFSEFLKEIKTLKNERIYNLAKEVENLSSEPEKA